MAAGGKRALSAAVHNSGVDNSLKSGYTAESSCEASNVLGVNPRQRPTSARQFLTSFNSSIECTTYLGWHTLSSDLSEKIRQGSVRVSRHHTLEYATIEEERGHGDKLPLLRRVQSPNSTQGISWGVAAFLLVNTALGAGVLNFPSAYEKAGGIVAATILQIIMMIALAATMLVLAYCSDLNGDNTYHDVLLSTVGRRAQQLAACSILVTCYGVSITFLIIIGDQYDRLFVSLYGDGFCQNWLLSREFTIAVTAIIFILPMCYFQRLNFLKYASSLGIFAMLYPVFLTAYVYYTQDIKPEFRESPSFTITDCWTDLLSIVPVTCFAYQTHEVLVPIYCNMRERNSRSLAKATGVCMFILFLIYSAMGTFGYLTFGRNAKPDIMQMFDGSKPEVLIGIAALIIKMVTSYPLLLICGRGAFDGLHAEICGISAEAFILHEKRRRIAITTFWFISTVTLAVTLSNIGVVIEMLGCLACANVFIFPGMCCIGMYTKEHRFRHGKRMLYVGLLMVALGCILFPLVLYKSVNEWINGLGHHLLCTK